MAVVVTKSGYLASYLIAFENARFRRNHMPSLYRAVSLLSFLFSICLSQAAAGADLPRMEGDLTPACRQALEIAREAFRSSDANLLNAHPPQPHVPVKLVLALSQMSSDTDDFVDEEWMGFDSQSDYGYTGIYYWKMSPDKVAPLIRISQIGNGTVFQTRLVSLEAEAATPDQQFERVLDEYLESLMVAPVRKLVRHLFQLDCEHGAWQSLLEVLRDSFSSKEIQADAIPAKRRADTGETTLANPGIGKERRNDAADSKAKKIG